MLPKLFRLFTVWTNCSSDLKIFVNFSRSLEHFFLTVGQNNFGNKIPFPGTTRLKTDFKRSFLHHVCERKLIQFGPIRKKNSQNCLTILFHKYTHEMPKKVLKRGAIYVSISKSLKSLWEHEKYRYILHYVIRT